MRLAAIVLLLTLALYTSTHGSENLKENVKLDIDGLTASQLNELNKNIRYIAVFEEALTTCGYNPRVEERARKAVFACLSSNSIERIASGYHSIKAWMKEHPAKWNCEKERNWLVKTNKLIDKEISDLDRRCRRCLVCGF